MVWCCGVNAARRYASWCDCFQRQILVCSREQRAIVFLHSSKLVGTATEQMAAFPDGTSTFAISSTISSSKTCFGYYFSRRYRILPVEGFERNHS